MAFIIDSHEDLAYNALNFRRDYRRSALDIRQIESGTYIPDANGDTLLGWPEYQSGQVALVFGTIFTVPSQLNTFDWEKMAFSDHRQARRINQAQINFYRDLADANPDYFRLVASRADLEAVLEPWKEADASYPDRTHPVGIMMLLEGAEGLKEPEELEAYWAMGLRMVGPVWGGTRFCGGTSVPGEFTTEGWALLRTMSKFGFILDISHMRTKSSLQALDYYEGPIAASHANARRLFGDDPKERHFSDETIRMLLERDGIIGVMPYNRFLRSGWQKGEERLPLEMLLDQIDYICQLAGDARHIGIGTDFDGGFGVACAPAEIDTIKDIRRIGPMLRERGYSQADIDGIFGGNWQSFLERNLPE
jgi:membrane dipeptidase